jgi:hypothetical protein
MRWGRISQTGVIFRYLNFRYEEILDPTQKPSFGGRRRLKRLEVFNHTLYCILRLILHDSCAILGIYDMKLADRYQNRYRIARCMCVGCHFKYRRMLNLESRFNDTRWQREHYLYILYIIDVYLDGPTQ